MEADKAAMHESSSDEGGISDDALFAACKKVKGKIVTKNISHKMNQIDTSVRKLEKRSINFIKPYCRN